MKISYFAGDTVEGFSKRQSMLFPLWPKLRTMPYEAGRPLSGLRRRRGEPVMRDVNWGLTGSWQVL